MCCSRTTSSFGSILDTRCAHDFIPEVPAQVAGRSNIGFSSEDLAEFPLDSRQADQSDPVSWLEFNQDVDITVVTKIVAQDRTEERQAPDVMVTTEGDDLIVCDAQSRGRHGQGLR
jgi:endonuclease/exonuclease/phosphatase (EEP) superfamily protein YafD